MAGPVYRSIGASVTTSSSAVTLTPSLPALDTNANGLLLAVCVSKNNAVHATATAGWSLVNQTNSGASFTASLWKAAQGSAAPVFTWTGSAACSAQVSYFTAPEGPIDIGSLLGTVGAGLANPHTSVGGNTSADNALAVYLDVAGANTGLVPPTGWTENSDLGATAGAMRHTVGSKAIATSGTASGAISVSGANAAWVQFQVELKLVSPTPGLQVSKAEANAFMEPPAGFSTSKIETTTWLETNDFSVSKLEVNSWLEPVVVVIGSRRMSFM